MAKATISIQQRRLFFAGKRVKTNHGTKPCANGRHVGPLINTARYDDFHASNPASEFDWRGFGECAACSSTVHRSEIVRAA